MPLFFSPAAAVNVPTSGNIYLSSPGNPPKIWSDGKDIYAVPLNAAQNFTVSGSVRANTSYVLGTSGELSWGSTGFSAIAQSAAMRMSQTQANIENVIIDGAITGSNGIAVRLGTAKTLSQGGASGTLVAIGYDIVTTPPTIQLAISGSGKLHFGGIGNTVGTPGNATINAPTGLVAVASGVSVVTVTNSVVNSGSIVLANLLDSADAIQVKAVVPSTSGSFTIFLSGNTIAARKVGFMVIN